MAGSILWLAPTSTCSSSIIRNSNIVICEPHFNRSAEPIQRMSQTQAASPKSLADIPRLYGSVQEYLDIRERHHGSNCGNESSLCMEIFWVLLQVYMCIDVILLLDNFWMEVDRYMCVQTLGCMYNTRWPINEIHHALRHHSCCLHCQSLPLIIFESYYHFKFSFLWRERRRMNISTGGSFVVITQSGDPEACTVKSHQIQKWASFTWSLANGVNVSSCHLCLQKLDRLLHWECSTIHHEFGDCSFLCPQLRLC